jgi:hypothetical protein
MKALKYTLLILIALLLAVRIALPFVIKSQINKKLEAADYPGHVEDVSLSVFKGALSLDGLTMTDKSGDNLKMRVGSISTDINWTGLLHKKILLSVDIQSPRLKIVLPQATDEAAKAKEEAKQKVKEKANKTAEKSLGQTLKELPNFRIDSIALHNGQVEAIYTDSKPDQHITVHDIDFEAINLTNSRAISESMFASANGNLKINSEGEGNIKMTFNPTAKVPTFTLKAQIKDLLLPELNPLFRHQVGLVVDSGTLSMFTESAAAKGAFQGYVKPVIRDLKVGNPSKGKPLKTLEKAAVQATSHLLSNSNQELSTRVPIEGRFDNPDIGLGAAVSNVLTNALTNSIRPSLEGKPTLKNVQKNAPAIKSKSKDKEKDKEKDKKDKEK